MSEEKLEEYHNDKRVAMFRPKKVDRRLGYRPEPKARYEPPIDHVAPMSSVDFNLRAGFGRQVHDPR